MWMCIDGLKDISCVRLGDSQVEDVQIDISAWRRRHPQLADYHVKVSSPSGIAYLPVVTLEDDILTWTITKADTAVAGRGSYAVMAVGPGGAQKITPSCIFEVKVSMAAFQTEEPPDPAKPWVDAVLEAADRAEAAADRAENAGGGSAGPSDDDVLWVNFVDAEEGYVSADVEFSEVVKALRENRVIRGKYHQEGVSAELPLSYHGTMTELATPIMVAFSKVVIGPFVGAEEPLVMLVITMREDEPTEIAYLPVLTNTEELDGLVQQIIVGMGEIEQTMFRATGRNDYGAMFYTDKNGTIAPLTLGEGLAIVDGVLTLTGVVTPPVEPEEPEEIVVELDDTGDMTVTGYAAVIDEAGNMTITGLAAELDDAGNMTFVKE